MAILPDAPGLEVEVLVDGQAVAEYGADDDSGSPDGLQIDNYIESRTGAIFSIRTKLDDTFVWDRGLVISVHIDGKEATAIVLAPETYANRQYQADIEGSRFSRGIHCYLQKFKFSELITDDGEICGMPQGLKDSLKSLGEISVKVQRVKEIENTQDLPPTTQGADTAPVAVPEKALKGKAISHKAAFAPPQSIKKVTTRKCKYVDTINKPFGTFNFRYRSRAALQAEMIIPRSPSPVPLEERDVDELNEEEMRELLRQQRARGAAPGHLKREKRERSPTIGDYSFEDDGLEVMDHRSSKSRRTSGPIETVDLTED